MSQGRQKEEGEKTIIENHPAGGIFFKLEKKDFKDYWQDLRGRKMRIIPEKLRQQLASDPFMTNCIYTNSPLVTWEHALIYSGKQINERFAIVPCEQKFNNDAHGKTKRFNKWVAYWRLFLSDPLYFDEQIEKYNIDAREFVVFF